MELFKTVQKNLATIYFTPIETDSWFDLVKQHSSCFFKSILSLISLFAYLICVAETLNEFMYSSFLSTASVFIAVAFTSSVFKTAALFKLLPYAADVVNKREYALFQFQLMHFKI